MKKLQLLLLTLLIPFLGFAQNNTWVRFQVQFDFYAPQESNFFMVNDSTGTQQFFYQPTQPYETLDTIINMVSGDYTISLTDNYGDGWISQFPASFKMGNTCQGDIILWDPVIGSFFQRDTTVNILPCAPPIAGCTDPLAINYDSSAVTNDGSCLYIEGCMNPNASNYDSTAQRLPNGLIVGGGLCNSYQWTQNYFGIDSVDYYTDSTIWQQEARVYLGINQQLWFVDAVVTQPGNCNTPAVLIFVVPTPQQADGNPFTFVPGTNVNANVGEQWKVDPCTFVYGCTSPTALNYNPLAGVNDGSCIEIPGCTDSTSVRYNPAATTDDGSCGVVTISCSPGKTLVTVEIMLDQYAIEIGWNIYTSNGVLIDSVATGAYGGMPTGAIVTKQICIDDNESIQFTITDSYGDGLGGAQFGGIDGTWIVYTSCDTLSQGMGDFGFTYSELATVYPCPTSDIYGCMDSDYQEYNSLATIDDSTCVTLNVFGCIDPNAFNYDPTATAQLQNPGCDNTLTLTDWADNGWAGSFLVVTQGNNWWGPFTLGPNDLILDTVLNLNTHQEVKTYFYSFNQSQQTSEQCMFQITNSEGFVISEGGTNSFTDELLSYNQWMEIYNDDANCGDNCIDKIYGCIDPLAFNYDSLANTSDYTCYYNPGCTDAAYEEYHTQGYIADYDNGSCVIYAIFGCMDNIMFNYDQYATVQWTSVVDQTDPCIAMVFGCLDPTAINYDPLANTEDYSCVPFIYGCTDPTQFNYDVNANTDNGSCLPYVFGCTDSLALNYNILANTDNGSCIPFLYGCTDSSALNYNALANTDDGSCITVIYGCIDVNAFNYDILANVDDGSCIPFIYGCTDATQFNFDPLANTDNGNCISFIYGCTDPTQFNYDFNANTDNSSCVSYIYGCMDSTAFNYNINANTDNGSCISVVNGCIDSTAINYNPLANTDDGSCIAELLGCTDLTAINYNSLANTDDGSCIATVLGCTDALAFNFNQLANVDDGSCIAFIYGCTDVTQFNFNPLANSDDGSCISYVYGCMDVIAFNYNSLANTDNGSCIPVVFGCTDSTQFNYDPLANTDNGSCVSFVYGCTDVAAFNYDPLANINDNSCCLIAGCTDPTALNYNQFACFDNNSCITVISGCTDVSAFNYDPTANVSDSTACLFDAGCYSGPGIPYWLNDLCYAWVIDTDNSCCTDDWDNYCVELYDYCQEGMPTNIEELLRENDFVIYPNPTKDIVNLAYNKNAKIDLYGPLGDLMASGDNIKQIDLSAYSNGIYVLYISYDNKIITHKIIKQ